MGGKRRLLLNEWLMGFFFLCFVSLTLCISSPVFSAEDGDAKKTEKKAAKESTDEFTLEEIVVTAEKREAVIQKIPMDIAVVRPDDMERLNIHQMSELGKMLPDLETNDVAGNGSLALKIRGVAMDFWNSTAETTVAVSIDGVALTRPNALEGKFYDLERVEMLKGPQGTLVGRGSTAGSLQMVSKKPDIGEFGGNLQFEYASFNRRRVEGAFNLPATDKMAFRISGRQVTRESMDDVGMSSQDMWSMRAAMKWEPTDRQSLNITVDKDNTNNKGGQNFQGVYFKTFGDLEIVANTDPTLTEAFRKVASGGTVSTPYKAAYYFEGDVSDALAKSESHGFSVTYSNELDFAWLTVKLGHRSSISNSVWYYTSSPTLQPVGSRLNLTWFASDTIDPVTGEVYPSGSGPQEEGKGYGRWFSYGVPTAPRYTSSGIDKWGNPYEEGDMIPATKMVLVPGSFPNVKGSLSDTYARSGEFETYLTSKESIANGDKYQWIAGGMALDDSVINDTYIAENAYNDIDLREYALYGEGSYELFSDVSFSAGYRRVWDTKDFTGYKYDSPGIVAGPDNLAFFSGVVFEKDRSMFNHFVYHVGYDYYKFNLQWQATEDIMPYIQYSKGMKAMNIDRATGNPIPPEQLNSVDAGVKSRLFDGRLQLNLSGYYYQYKNKNTWLTSYQCRVRNWDDKDTPDDTSDDEFTGCKVLGDSANQDVDYINYVFGVMSPGGAKQHGGAFQATWVITPVDRIMANVSYQNNKLDNYKIADAMIKMYEPLWGVGNVDSALLPTNQIDKSGDEFEGRPWRGNFTYSHMWFLESDTLTYTLTGLYEGDEIDDVRQANTENEYSYPGNPAYWTFDMAFDYSSTKWVPEGCRWSARIFSNNVLNSQELATARYNDDYNQTNYQFAPNSGYISGTFVQPRQSGIQVNIYF